MKMICGVQVIESIDDFLHDEKLSAQFYAQQFGANSDDWLRDVDRMQRCEDAAADGADGSTHAEVIEDFQEFGSELLREAEKSIESAMDASPLWDEDADLAQRKSDLLLEQVELCRRKFSDDVDRLTQWHVANGSYGKQIG